MTTETVGHDLMTRLARHRAIGDAPASEHAWLVTHGTLRTFAVGDVITPKGAQAHQLLIVLDGHFAIRVDRGAGAHKIFEWRTGDVGGVMPYSRGASPPNDVVVEEPTELITVEKELFQELTRECPTVTATLVHAMVDRARQFTSSDLRDEKLISLGKLAAGLAHELNNPASALARSAKLLGESLDASERAARQLGAAGLNATQLAAIDELRAMCGSRPLEVLSSVERADREEAVADWLADRGADVACANPLVESGVTLERLETLAESLDGEALDAALRWLAAGCLGRTLCAEIETAASRVHGLVASVKGFSFMDHAPTPEPVDVRRGIADTLTMLGAKTRAKSVQIALDVPESLPAAHAIGAELNQVWMNLIDNALDAVPDGGHVSVSAAPEPGAIVVRVVDDGPGIPAHIVGRIFDPFFTTKGVGKGSGLGLDIVRRLLQRHEAEIAVESVPGRTEFQVRLPLAR